MKYAFILAMNISKIFLFLILFLTGSLAFTLLFTPETKELNGDNLKKLQRHYKDILSIGESSSLKTEARVELFYLTQSIHEKIASALAINPDISKELSSLSSITHEKISHIIEQNDSSDLLLLQSEFTQMLQAGEALLHQHKMSQKKSTLLPLVIITLIVLAVITLFFIMHQELNEAKSNYKIKLNEYELEIYRLMDNKKILENKVLKSQI